MSNIILLSIPLTVLVSWALAIQSEKDITTNWMKSLSDKLESRGYRTIISNERKNNIQKFNDSLNNVWLSIDIGGHAFEIYGPSSKSPKKQFVKLVAHLSISKKQVKFMIKYNVIDQLLNTDPFRRIPKLSKEIFDAFQPKMDSEKLLSTYLQFLNQDQTDDAQKIVLHVNQKQKDVIALLDELIQLAELINHLNFVSEENAEEAPARSNLIPDYGLLCVVCNQSVLIDQLGKYDLIYQLLCCNYFVHKEHLQQSLKNNNGCINCGNRSPRWIRVNLN